VTARKCGHGGSSGLILGAGNCRNFRLRSSDRRGASKTSIFVTAERDRRLTLLCLDRSTGEPRWERTIQADRSEPQHALNHPASSTAVTDGENVYAFFGDYGLVSYDSIGREGWRAPLGPFTIGWGPASSPVLVDDAVVIPLDGYVGRSSERSRARRVSCVGERSASRSLTTTRRRS
jgi:outer membrane protein assembly factor BamB